VSDTIITYKLDGSSLVVESKYGTETYDAQFLVAALLIYVARGSGEIAPEESAEMLELIHEYFQLPAAESFDLLTRAMSELAEKPELPHLLAELGQSLAEAEKEDIAVMALKVIAADGRREVSEMERFNGVLAAIDTPAHVIHRAFDRYFADTMPGDS
jgi:uncharacterized tellurite resistance protein B-like protein